MRTVLLLILVGLAPPPMEAQVLSSPPPTPWLLPDTVVRPPDALPLILKESPAAGITTIRVFIPLDESFAEAGTGRVLAGAAMERVRGNAARIGAAFQARRTADGIAYSVTGSDEDFDYLAYVLRSALAEPVAEGVVVRRLATQARRTLEREQETGRGRVASDLTARLCPTHPPLNGLSGALARLNPERLRRFWRRTHVANRASVIVVTRAPLPLVLSSVRTLGLPAEGAVAPAGQVDAPSRSVPAPQLLRRWFGEARPLPADAPADAAVLGRLLDAALGVAGTDYDLYAEVRRVRCATTIVAVGTAYRAGDRAMRSRVTGLLNDIAGSLQDSTVRTVGAGIRGNILREVSTPAGLAAALGREGADQGRPDGLAATYERLGNIGLAEMRAYLEQVSALTPLQAELRP